MKKINCIIRTKYKKIKGRLKLVDTISSNVFKLFCYDCGLEFTREFKDKFYMGV